MDLEKAYNKIDNLCCVNHMAVTLSNMSIDKGVIPNKIDFFNGYNETHDDSFCKDTKDMIEALETIEEVVNLQKEMSCPLKVLFRALKQERDNYKKILEIIKEKRVNVDLFWNDFVDNGFGYHYYLEKWYKYQSIDKQKLTEEEFDLLKEVLE